MADTPFAGGEDKPEFAEVIECNTAVLKSPDDFDAWEKLVRAAESL